MEKPLSKQKIEKNCIFSGTQTEQDLLLDESGPELTDPIFSDNPRLPDSFTMFEKAIDKFTNEIRINIFRSREYWFPHKHPIDLLYISNPNGDRFYVLFTGSHWLYSTGSLIFNIDERTNIELKIDNTDEFLKGKTYDELRFWNKDEQAYRKEYRTYLYISKEDYLKCCHANHLSVRVNINDSSPTSYEEECDELISCFQMLYNHTCDDTMFAENKQKWLVTFGDSLMKYFDTVEKKLENDKKKETEKKQDKTKEILIAVLIGLGVLALGLSPLLF